jgi:uncharacterized protein YjbI with pentapeptide repeats
MANRENLDLIEQGVEVWNKWRVENTDVIPDLRGADLREADLSWADLRWADLREADLREADLSWADLTRANLSRANLSNSDLRTPYVTADQLKEAKTLYKAKLLPKTETELREKHPERYDELIKMPVEPDNETK